MEKLLRVETNANYSWATRKLLLWLKMVILVDHFSRFMCFFGGKCDYNKKLGFAKRYIFTIQESKVMNSITIIEP